MDSKKLACEVDSSAGALNWCLSVLDLVTNAMEDDSCISKKYTPEAAGLQLLTNVDTYLNGLTAVYYILSGTIKELSEITDRAMEEGRQHA